MICLFSLGLSPIAWGSPPDGAVSVAVASSQLDGDGQSNQEKAAGLRAAAEAAEDAGDTQSAADLRDWAVAVESTSTPATLETIRQSRPESTRQGDGAEGITTYLVQLELRGIARLLRTAPQTFISLAGEYLDDAAVDTILTQSQEIADALEDVANLPDLASDRPEIQVRQLLGQRFAYGTATLLAGIVNALVRAVL